jgi:hypothetical protein
MPRYLLAYHGGHVDETPAGIKTVMEAFGTWFAELGPALADPGNPVGRTCTVDHNGNVSDGGGANPVSGYSIIEAASIEEAIDMVKRGPIVQGGRSVEVAETFSPL